MFCKTHSPKTCYTRDQKWSICTPHTKIQQFSKPKNRLGGPFHQKCYTSCTHCRFSRFCTFRLSQICHILCFYDFSQFDNLHVTRKRHMFAHLRKPKGRALCRGVTTSNTFSDICTHFDTFYTFLHIL